jgi:hypothetical protein
MSTLGPSTTRPQRYAMSAVIRKWMSRARARLIAIHKLASYVCEAIAIALARDPKIDELAGGTDLPFATDLAARLRREYQIQSFPGTYDPLVVIWF